MWIFHLSMPSRMTDWQDICHSKRKSWQSEMWNTFVHLITSPNFFPSEQWTSPTKYRYPTVTITLSAVLSVTSVDLFKLLVFVVLSLILGVKDFSQIPEKLSVILDSLLVRILKIIVHPLSLSSLIYSHASLPVDTVRKASRTVWVKNTPVCGNRVIAARECSVHCCQYMYLYAVADIYTQ